MDFSNWLTGNVSDEQKITELQTFPLQIQSPAQAGLNLKRRSDGARESDRQSLKLWMADGICPHRFDEGQAKKSARGMPWHQEPMKDVISCDKLRGAANEP